MADKRERSPAAELIAGECFAFRIRTLNRVVTTLYDEALRPHGLRVGQLNILVAIAMIGHARPKDLCRVLQMDKSTLSRDVTIMRRQGWLDTEDSVDARARPLKVSAVGHALLEQVVPAWRLAQEKAEAMIGVEAGTALGQVADRLRNDGASRR